MGLLRVLIVLLLFACLPLKGIAAVAMPFCGEAMPSVAEHHGHAASSPVQPHADHGAGHAMVAADPANPDSVAPTSVVDCAQCGLCHLACATALPVDAREFRVAFAPVFGPAVPGAFVSFIPEVLFRPPLRARA